MGLALDDEGVRPEALERALRVRPAAIYLQPRAQNPTGITTTPARVAALAAVLEASSRTMVVEDDHQGDIASSPAVSLGSHLPERTIRIQSFSKSHGPDLRLAAVGGPAAVIDPLTERMRLGPSWSSRLLQHVLVDMLTHESTRRAVRRARAQYADRRSALVTALTTRGVTTTGTDGINLWVSVASEADALLLLASHGIGVAAGSPFFVARDDTRHIRVTCGLVAHDREALADRLAEAASTPSRAGRSPRAIR